MTMKVTEAATAKKASTELSPNTLFVRGIPPSCSNETLSEIFSKAGAIKECFVVKYKNPKLGSDRPCIGYVAYTTPTDAKTALKMEKDFSIDGNTLKVSFARKKKFSKKKGKKGKEETSETTQSPQKQESSASKVMENAEECDVAKVTSSKSDISELDDSFTVLVSGFPALYKKEHVLTLWKKSGLKEPKELVFPCENIEEEEKSEKNTENEGKNVRQIAKFTVETKQAALKAYNKLADKVVGKKKNYTLKVNFLTPEGNFKAARKSRLIVRNVSFQCSEDDLKKTFGCYGTITEVKIPTKPDGKKRGFAFVQFSHVFEAARAMKAINMQEIKGRKVAIDWSLPKEKYKEMSSANMEPVQERKTESKHGEENTPASDDEDSANVEEPAPVSDDENSASSEDASNDSGLEEDESESNKETSEDDESEEEESDNEQESDDDDGEENPYSKPMKKASSKPIKKLDPKASHDVHEGRTVFVLNLPYDTNEEKLAEALEEYGELCYTKIVMNHETGMSKGCGFAQFKTVDQANSCMEALGSENSGKMIDGRQIKVVAALSRGDTDKREKEGKKKKEKEDKRNLYLGREGLVRAGTQAAEGLSAIELKKRERIENAKRAKLKNLNVFVSTTRLCVHNLPKSVNEKKLREILLQLFKNRRVVRITECRIMRDMKNVNEQGVGQPLGYAFVNFAKHENALKALRTMNNNPEIFGPIKRPIVEFALENKKALEIQEQRKRKFLAKQKLRQNIQKIDGSERHMEQNKKKIGRRVRQQMKRRLESGEKEEETEKRRKVEEKSDVGDSKFRKGQKEKKFKSKFEPKKMNSGEKTTTEERKPFQGSSGTSRSGKKLPLPTHSRPKVRSKDKGKILEQMRRSKKLNSKSEQRKVMQKFENKRRGNDRNFQKNIPKSADTKWKPQKHKPDRREETEFNALVAKYTKTFMDKTAKAKKSGEKWYAS